MKYILLLLICLAINSCGIVKNQGWKLQRTDSNEVTSKMEDFEQHTPAEDLSFSDIAQVELRSSSLENYTEIQAPETLPVVEKRLATSPPKYNPSDLKETTPIFPKKERTELEKIQRSFKRQATWFFVMSIISGFLGFGVYDLENLLAASPLFLFAITGLTAFVIAIVMMVKAKRLKNADQNDENTDVLNYLRKMKKTGFIGLMIGLGIGITSFIVLLFWF